MSIVLQGGYGLSGLLIVISVIVLSMGRPEWNLYLGAGVFLAVFFTLVWAAVKR